MVGTTSLPIRRAEAFWSHHGGVPNLRSRGKRIDNREGERTVGFLLRRQKRVIVAGPEVSFLVVVVVRYLMTMHVTRGSLDNLRVTARYERLRRWDCSSDTVIQWLFVGVTVVGGKKAPHSRLFCVCETPECLVWHFCALRAAADVGIGEQWVSVG